MNKMKRSKSLASGVNNKSMLICHEEFESRDESTNHRPRVNSTKPTVPPKPAKPRRDISMSDLCNKLKNELPMKLTVVQGTYGVTSESTFSEDEHLTAHFVLTIDHVVFRPLDSSERPMYKIPMTSSIIASLIYNPRKKLDEALMGYVFPSPSHLMNTDPNMPRFVAVIKEHVDNSDPQYSVELNDVLLIVKQSKIKAGKKRILECIHVTSGLTKFIREDSNVRFSTRPKQVSLMLKTVTQYLHLPVEVLITIPPDPQLMTTEKNLVGLMSERGKDRHIICTRGYDSDHNSILYAIPENFELDCRQLKCSENEQEVLCSKSAKYFENFDPRLVNYDIPSLYDCLPVDAHPNSVQSTLYAMVFSDKNNRITCPEKLRRYFPKTYSLTSVKPSAPQGASIENRVRLLEESVQALFNEMRVLKEQIGRKVNHDNQHDDFRAKKFEGMAETALEIASGLRKSVSELQKHNDQMSGKMDIFTETVVQLQEMQETNSSFIDPTDSDYQPLIPARKNMREESQSGNSKPPPSSSFTSPQTISSVNRRYLMSLTAEEVGQVLAQLDMEHHKTRFLNENITGEQLANFSRIDLLKLNVSKQSEREKLLQFITGEESVFPFVML